VDWLGSVGGGWFTLALGFWLALARRQGHLDRLDICCILGMAGRPAPGRDVALAPARQRARGTLLVVGSTLAVGRAGLVVVVGSFRILNEIWIFVLYLENFFSKKIRRDSRFLILANECLCSRIYTWKSSEMSHLDFKWCVCVCLVECEDWFTT
jgi:hypothetical protein